MGLIDARDIERDRNCDAGLHLYDPVSADCLWCERVEPKDWNVAHAELVAAGEPPVGSVVLVEGTTGNAVQRFQSDGLWHYGSGRITNWDRLMRNDRPRSRVRILYVAPPRTSPTVLGQRRDPRVESVMQIGILR